MIEPMVKKGRQLELSIESGAFEGLSIARVDRLVVFVPFGVPGDRVRATVIRKRRRYVEAVIDEVIEPSKHRITPRCVHFGTCGGCRWQNCDYEQQIRMKREQVASLLQRVGGLSEVTVHPTVPSPKEYGYRNKMEFSFGVNRWLTHEEIASGRELQKGFALGLHIPKRFDKILDLEECHLQNSWSGELLAQVRELALSEGWEAYNTRQNTGFLRNLVVRTASATDEIMLVLVTRTHEPARMEKFRLCMDEHFPQVTTIINSINPTRSPVPPGDEEILLKGEGFIEEELRGLRFRITPTSFFQPNTLQAERLFEVVLRYAGLEGEEVLYDLYSGLGAIALSAADSVGRVVGVEEHAESVQQARANADRNGISNCEFFACDATEALRNDFLSSTGRPDVLILDPPRAGLHDDVVKGILRARPSRVVYTSCNPATQARDLKALSEAYRVEEAQPVDMFPQTYHIENVARLERLS